MSSSRIPHTDSRITYGGTWPAAITDANTATGTYRSTTTNGATATFTLASGSGITAIMLVGVAAYNQQTWAPTVTVDGVAQPDPWGQWNQTTNAGATYTPSGATPNNITWYRTCYRPISFADPAAAHTVVLTAAGGGATLDAIELYTAATSLNPRLTSFGMSVVAGQSPATAGGRFSALLTAWLGLSGDNNQGIGGEALSGDTGVSATAHSMGWMRVDSAVTGTSYAGATDWWQGRTPTVAIIEHCINDAATFPGLTAATWGANYSAETYKQRLREALWRMNANSPLTLILSGGATPNASAPFSLPIPAGSANLTYQAWGALTAAVASEATMKNVQVVDLFGELIAQGMNGYSGPHPADLGHLLMARQYFGAVEQARTAAAVRAGR